MARHKEYAYQSIPDVGPYGTATNRAGPSTGYDTGAPMGGLFGQGFIPSTNPPIPPPPIAPVAPGATDKPARDAIAMELVRQAAEQTYGGGYTTLGHGDPDNPTPTALEQAVPVAVPQAVPDVPTPAPNAPAPNAPAPNAPAPNVSTPTGQPPGLTGRGDPGAVTTGITPSSVTSTLGPNGAPNTGLTPEGLRGSVDPGIAPSDDPSAVTYGPTPSMATPSPAPQGMPATDPLGNPYGVPALAPDVTEGKDQSHAPTDIGVPTGFTTVGVTPTDPDATTSPFGAPAPGEKGSPTYGPVSPIGPPAPPAPPASPPQRGLTPEQQKAVEDPLNPQFTPPFQPPPPPLTPKTDPFTLNKDMIEYDPPQPVPRADPPIQTPQVPMSLLDQPQVTLAMFGDPEADPDNEANAAVAAANAQMSTFGDPTGITADTTVGVSPDDAATTDATNADGTVGGVSVGGFGPGVGLGEGQSVGPGPDGGVSVGFGGTASGPSGETGVAGSIGGGVAGAVGAAAAEGAPGTTGESPGAGLGGLGGIGGEGAGGEGGVGAW